MAKKNFKYDRLAEDIKYAIGEIINDEIDGLDYVTIYEVHLTKDLGDAKIFVQALDVDKEAKILRKLESSKGFIKKRLAENVQMRRVPNLIFKFDHSLDNYNKIESLIKEF